MGIVVLEGGGPFIANDALDRELLSSVAGPIQVFLTAAAFENPDNLRVIACKWADRLGLKIDFCDVFSRPDAREAHIAEKVRASKAVVFAGESSSHLRSVLLNSPVWDSVLEVAESGVVVGVGNCASALCDPMIDPRGGALGLGLGLVFDLTVVAEVEKWSEERLARTRSLASVTLAEIPTGSAVFQSDGSWVVRGEAKLFRPSNSTLGT